MSQQHRSKGQSSDQRLSEADVNRLVEQKLEMMAQIHQLRADIRNLDLQLVRAGARQPEVRDLVGNAGPLLW